MSLHKTFCAFGAYAVNLIDPNATVVMPLASAADLGNPIDPARLLTLNLNKRLKTDNRWSGADWDEAILDTTGMNQLGQETGPLPSYTASEIDPATGSIIYTGIPILTIGPIFSGQRNNVGGIYVERSKFFAEIRPLIGTGKTSWPHPQWPHIYQIMSSARLVNGVITRYHGFHAVVVEDSGAAKKLKITHALGAKVFTVDLSDRDVCDDPAILAMDVQDPWRPAVIASVLDATSPVDAEGAVFLSLKTCVANSLSGPKEPIGGD